MIWLGIIWLTCAAVLLPMVERAPELPWHD
jgi:hypothetical protein